MSQFAVLAPAAVLFAIVAWMLRARVRMLAFFEGAMAHGAAGTGKGTPVRSRIRGGISTRDLAELQFAVLVVVLLILAAIAILVFLFPSAQ